MRTIALITACLGIAVAAIGCIDPSDRRPGLWLSGEVVGEVSDWSFSDEYPEIYIEVGTPYFVPHSVTIVCATLDGQLYVGARNPDQKRWVSYLERDDDVRLKIGDRVYEGRLERVEDARAVQSVIGAYAKKYDRPITDPSQRPEIWYWKVLPRSG